MCIGPSALDGDGQRRHGIQPFICDAWIDLMECRHQASAREAIAWDERQVVANHHEKVESVVPAKGLTR